MRDSKSRGRKALWVQIPPSAQKLRTTCRQADSKSCGFTAMSVRPRPAAPISAILYLMSKLRSHSHRVRIYQSYWHLAITLFIIAVPFVFLLLFSEIANIARGKLFADIFISFARLFVAYWIALALAWVFAVGFYKGKRASVALPVFDVLQSFPTFAALPLVAYFWGASNLTIIFFLVVTVIWPIFFSLISSLKLIKSDWEEVAEVYNLSGFDYLKNFIWPVSIPGIITGSIVGLGDGWEALVATEIILNIKSGLGSFFNAFSQNTGITIFGIIGFLLLIFSINKLIWVPLLDWSHHRMEE